VEASDYETDFYLWTQRQAVLLRQGEFNRMDLDLENIAEEIESMGRSQKNSLQNYLCNVLMHLLKWRYQPERRNTSWQLSIYNGRDPIERLCKNSPSLRTHLLTSIEEEYPRARRNAALETGLPLATLPIHCPFTVSQILDSDFWPD